MGERSVARPRELRTLSSRCARCEHVLTAKEPHDAFGRVGSTLVEHFCGCVHGQAASGSCFDRDIAHFDERAVRGAPGVARAV